MTIKKAAAAKKPATRKKPKRKTSIGTSASAKRRTPEERQLLREEAVNIGIDAAQMSRAVMGGEYARARTQQRQIIKRLQRLRL